MTKIVSRLEARMKEDRIMRKEVEKMERELSTVKVWSGSTLSPETWTVH